MGADSSGALFLNPDKNIPVKKLYTKYIFRIFTAFLFWSFVYSLMDYVKDCDFEQAVMQSMSFVFAAFLPLVADIILSFSEK